jgi:predicted transcriptional regulator
MAKTEIEVGKSLRNVLAEVGAAWKAAEAGDAVASSSRISFVDWAALCAVLTPKRYELIRHLRQQSEPSIRALSRSLGRDVKRVHQDVVALEELGLIERDPETGAVSTGLDEVSSVIRFAA